MSLFYAPNSKRILVLLNCLRFVKRFVKKNDGCRFARGRNRLGCN